ncbi:MAG: TonB-dependent receptor [Deltaproteobacteria bacterium HGW-Deltaproteobacteria-6]|nr:MAG: TonB-dependent receptor [Deltaproteobacteria bacterium HGW-Deltaproteobacteria-6]
MHAFFYAYAAEPGNKQMDLEEVVVTATRTERTTEEIPAGVSVVTKEKINDTRMFNLKEALTGIPGVQSESKNGGYDARLIIRGAGLKARYGVREIMILLDGVPITDPDGMSRLDFVDSEMVERIDVVKGPNSTLYGANATGGVINIITKSLFEETKSVKVGYGSNNTQLYNGTYGTHFKNTYISATGSRRSNDSWRQWNEFSTNQGSLKVGQVFSEKVMVEGNISLTKADLQLPGTLTKAQYDNDISQLTSEQWRNSGRYSNILYSSLKAEIAVDNIKFKPLAYFQKWDHYHPVTGLINDGGASVYGADLQTDIKHTIWGMKGIATMGIAGQMDKTDSDKYTYRDFVTSPTGRLLYTTSDEKGNFAENGKDTISKWGVYLQESLRPTDKWIIDTGIRYDQVLFDLHTEQFREYNYATARYVTNRETIIRDKSFEHISPRIGVVYKLTPIINLYSNISTGFQTPQTSELSLNPDLVPSETYNYETGFKARFKGGHSIDLALFYINVKDDIVQTQLPDNQSSYSNAGETRKKGLELSAQVQALKGLHFGGAYTYSDFTFAEFNEVINGTNFRRDGNRLPYIPRHQYALFTAYKHSSGFRARMETNTWGEYEVDNANSETYKGYSLITNALVGYEWKGLDMTLDAYNIFNTRYAVEVTKDSGGAARYRPGGPCTLMARISYKF